jgi:hypothetical protein
MESKTTVSGSRREAEFWQLIETTEIETGRKNREYVFFVVYSFTPQVWDTIYSYYMRDTFKDMPESPAKKEMRNMFAEIGADTKREIEKDEATFKAELAAQEQALKHAQEVELAKINQQTAQNADQAKVAQTEARTKAQTQQAAFKGSDPVKQAAAVITPADGVWVNALGTAAKVLF